MMDHVEGLVLRARPWKTKQILQLVTEKSFQKENIGSRGTKRVQSLSGNIFQILHHTSGTCPVHLAPAGPGSSLEKSGLFKLTMHKIIPWLKLKGVVLGK